LDLKKYKELQSWLDRRGLTMADALKLAGAMLFSLGVIGIMLYGAIGALLL
jgi:hypothetical protein